jgi:carbohydrate-binding DOMON domain-containing protein
MDLIADIFLAAGAIGAGFYCFVLGRRLNRFNNLEKGVGGAVAVLSAQVDDLTKMLAAAQGTAAASADTLSDLTMRAEQTSKKLELQMASLHDIPDAPAATQAPKPTAVVPQTTIEPMFTRHKAGAR